MRHLLLIALIFLSFLILAQSKYEATEYSIHDGLMSKEIRYVQQDPRGVIWVFNGNGVSLLYGDKIENKIDYRLYSENSFQNIVFDSNSTKTSTGEFRRGMFNPLDISLLELQTPSTSLNNFFLRIDQFGNRYIQSTDSAYYRDVYILNESDTVNIPTLLFSKYGIEININNRIRSNGFGVTSSNKLFIHREKDSSILIDLVDSSLIKFDSKFGTNLWEDKHGNFIFLELEMLKNDNGERILYGNYLLKSINRANNKTELIREIPRNYTEQIKVHNKQLWINHDNKISKINEDGELVELKNMKSKILDFAFMEDKILILQDQSIEIFDTMKYSLIEYIPLNSSFENIFVSSQSEIFVYGGRSGLVKYTKRRYKFKSHRDPIYIYSKTPISNGSEKYFPSGTKAYLVEEDKSIKYSSSFMKDVNYIAAPVFSYDNMFFINYFIFDEGSMSFESKFCVRVDSNLKAHNFNQELESQTRITIKSINGLQSFANSMFITYLDKNEFWRIIEYRDGKAKSIEIPELNGEDYDIGEEGYYLYDGTQGNIIVFKSLIDSPSIIFDLENQEFRIDSMGVFNSISLFTPIVKIDNGWLFTSEQKLYWSYRGDIDSIDFSPNYLGHITAYTNSGNQVALKSGFGLISFDYKLKTYQVFNSKYEFLQNDILNLFFDPNPRFLWISTNSSIYKIDFENLKASIEPVIISKFDWTFDYYAGKPIFSGDSVLEIITTTKTFTFILNENIESIPQIHFKTLRMNYEEVDWLNYSKSIDSSYTSYMPYNMQLAHNQNHLTFDYQGVNHSNKEPLIYYHQLVGMDTSFIGTQSKSATYSNLEPGDYTFRVYAQDENENQSRIIECSFSIAPPYWETWWFISIMILLAGGSLYSGYQWRVKALKERQLQLETEVELATHEIREQKAEIEEAHREITDSIAYAKRIQGAILPPIKLVKEYLDQSFVFYQPKDIVAGDFYWMSPEGKTTFFAAADCTGHGVPGAMVSVVCHNALNRSVKEFELKKPAEILDKTRELVITEFEKSEDEVKDGMDIALCSLKGKSLEYAGAHNPLWIIRNGATEVKEIKANKQPIGQFDNPVPYTNHKITLNKGDSIYIFSDGFVDQFGGEKGKKLKSPNFKKLLLSIQEMDMDAQRLAIEESFISWKGTEEQIDDVCVIGVRI